MRFPSATVPRRGQVRHDISRNIWLTVIEQKVTFVAGVFFKRSKRAATRAVSTNLERLLAKWRNPKRKTPRPALPPIEDARPSMGRQAG